MCIDPLRADTGLKVWVRTVTSGASSRLCLCRNAREAGCVWAGPQETQQHLVGLPVPVVATRFGELGAYW